MAVRRSRASSKRGKASLSEQAVFYVRAKLLRGELRSGDLLEECLLESQFRLSREQILQVFEQLALEDVLEAAPDGKFRVREFTDRDIYDAVELQSVLEGAAARLAAMRLESLSDLKTIRSCHTRMVALIKRHKSSPRFWTQPSEDLIVYSRLNAGFHQGLIDLSKSRLIAAAAERIHAIPFSSPAAITIPVGSEDIPQIAMEQHAGILDAIARRQPELAERLARQHALAALRNLELDLEGRRHGEEKKLKIAK
jgi:GntR family transcriptional regulator, vanillate catabolism transcriptional regulator